MAIRVLVFLKREEASTEQILNKSLFPLVSVQSAAPKSLGVQVVKPHNVQGGDLQA